MFPTGVERKATNIESLTPQGGNVFLDPNHNLVAIDRIDCENGSMVYVGNTDVGEPKYRDGLTGEIRVGLINAEESCGGPIQFYEQTYSNTVTDINCL